MMCGQPVTVGRVEANGWDHPPERPCIRPGVIDLWLLDLARIGDDPAVPGTLLTTAERTRIEAKGSEAIRRCSAIARGALRLLLGRYLGMDPMTVPIDRTAHGKPVLVPPADTGLRFNQSHSGGLVLFGVTGDGPLGVDIEQIRTLASLDRIARRQMTARERAIILHGDHGADHAMFFSFWTRKEAVGKAIGTGLLHRMSSFDVSGCPSETVQFAIPELAGGPDTSWYALDIATKTEYRAAVATTVPPVAIRQYRYTPWDDSWFEGEMTA